MNPCGLREGTGQTGLLPTGQEGAKQMKRQTDAPKKFKIEVDAHRIASIFEALEAAQIRREWTPGDFIDCAIANQIEMLRLCGFSGKCGR